MPTGRKRDLVVVREGLSRWVASQSKLSLFSAASAEPSPSAGVDGLRVVDVARAEGGMANETLLVDLGPSHPGIVVRLPPLEESFLDYTLAPQAAVQNAVAAEGVPAPSPAVVVDDTSWIGCEFLAMPRVEGRIPGPAPTFDPWLSGLDGDERRRVHDGLIATLVGVHSVDWHAAGLGSSLPRLSVGDTIDQWSRYVDWAGDGEPLPALTAALMWCRAHVPDDGQSAADGSGTVLCWGDARLGNLVFDPSLRVRAVLDWDLASLGPAEMDLGWYLGLDAMMEALFGTRLDGFPSRAESVAAYEEQRGVAVHALDWHEVFALTRALAINDRHQRIAGDRRRLANPMCDVLMDRLSTAEVPSSDGFY